MPIPRPLPLALRRRAAAAALCLLGACGAAMAQELKLPVESSEQGSLYIAPKVTPNETAATTNGATVGVQRPDGSSAYGGMDTSTARPTYSVGGSTGGNVSFSAGASSDGKKNNGVKAGITIKY